MSRDLPPVVLDITRTVTQLGQGHYSGIDRVEQAYITHLISRPGDVWFLSRGTGGFALLDRDGMKGLMAYVRGKVPLGRPDLIGLMARRLRPGQRRAQAAMRRLARHVVPTRFIGWMLKRATGGDFVYLNVSHSARSSWRLGKIRAAGARAMAFMVHDLISINYPHYASAELRRDFPAMLEHMAAAADLLIYNSSDTRGRAEAWLGERGASLPGIVAHLGTQALPPGMGEAPTQPHFVYLSTIEPRKNHRLLIDIWRRFWNNPDGPRPELHLIGRRGWENDEVFAQLDSEPFMGKLVFEKHGTDDEIATLLSSAQAMLFPSFAEGYGMPLTEAMAAGCPVICSDIGTLREVGGDYPTYLDPGDENAWFEAISAAASAPFQARNPVPAPSWEAHFEAVFDRLSALDTADRERS